MITLEQHRRISKLAKLPKLELIRLCKNGGTLNPNLHRWSKHDLAVQAAKHEQRLAVA